MGVWTIYDLDFSDINLILFAQINEEIKVIVSQRRSVGSVVGAIDHPFSIRFIAQNYRYALVPRIKNNYLNKYFGLIGNWLLGTKAYRCLLTIRFSALYPVCDH